jgi:hypothetical protein
MPQFTTRSILNVSPEQFWSSMSMEAVNWELAPWVRMSAPPEWQACTIDQWRPGEVLFKSWILLLGVLPSDLHSLRLLRIEAPEGFVESSTSWMNREWRHERHTRPHPQGCVLEDVVTVTGRLPWLTALLMPVYRLVFAHRHRRLRMRYGGSAA